MCQAGDAGEAGEENKKEPVETCRPVLTGSPAHPFGTIRLVLAPAKQLAANMKLSVEFTLEELVAIAVLVGYAIKFSHVRSHLQVAPVEVTNPWGGANHNKCVAWANRLYA